MNKITIFSWGYWGWGNSTQELIRSVDAVERARGFKPPMFVDIRMRRAGRAPGFIGSAFEKMLGLKGYRWFQSLGNRSVVTKAGKVVINNPRAVKELLAFAEKCGRERRRIIFFCSCKIPSKGGRCHRFIVRNLLIKTARKHNRFIDVIEWPGGEAEELTIHTDRKTIQQVRDGRKSIPTNKNIPLSKLAQTPYGSIMHLRSSEESIKVMTGPARFSKGWLYPIFNFFESNISKDKVRDKVHKWRLQNKLVLVSSRSAE